MLSVLVMLLVTHVITYKMDVFFCVLNICTQCFKTGYYFVTLLHKSKKDHMAGQLVWEMGIRLLLLIVLLL